MQTNNITNQGLIIFGASGDLAYRKLIPALCNIYDKGMLPSGFFMLGVGRTEMNDETFRDKMKQGIKKFVEKTSSTNFDKIDNFLDKLYYLSINTEEPADYLKLKTRLAELNTLHNTNNNFIFYLSTPPSLYSIIADNIASIGLNKESDTYFRRLIIEKPFGIDVETAMALNTALLKNYKENQIYRIDHYMGKETVQNIFVTRFANSIYEPLWNRNYVQRVEITSAENIGVENRGRYYDNAGALRDMVQNHLLQLLAIVAMEPPASLSSEAIRNEKMKVFQSLRPLTPEFIKNNIVFGQYTESTIKKEKINGYRQEQDVPPTSRTETYIAMKLFIDNWRWSEVPFYIRSGKRMPTRVTEVVIHFKPAPNNIFGDSSNQDIEEGNKLVIRIQPDEGLLLKTMMKVPGAGYKIKAINMDFHYAHVKDLYVPEAYERLILDAMIGDSTLYVREDALIETWKFVQPILDYMKTNEAQLEGYPAGTWGPEDADKIMGNYVWRYPCKNLTEDGIYCEL